MTAILACDVFPQLEKVDPILSPEDDEIPDKFGPKWFEAEREEESKLDQINEERHFE